MNAARATAERVRVPVPKKTAPKKATSKKSATKKSATNKSVRTAPSKKTPAKHAPAKAKTAAKTAGKTAAKKVAKKTPAKKGSAAKAPLFLIDVAALRSRTRRRRLVLGSLLLLVGAFFAVALIQAQLVQTQAEVDRIQAEINRLENDLALLDREVVEASSPEVIVQRATRELGMVRALRPVYLVAARPLEP